MIYRDRLRALLHYDPMTGQFRWYNRPKFSKGRTIEFGSLAGHRTAHGYITIRIDGKSYYAHRLAWFYVTGDWPAEEIDHINRIGTDNRFANLRLAARQQNVANRTRRRDNRSGFKGVYVARSGRFVAQITVNRRAVHLGTFATAEEAAAKRDEVARSLYAEFYPGA